MSARVRGFSLLEVVTVISLLMIMSVVAISQLRRSVLVLDADKVANQVGGQLRYARQIALDDRRNVVVEFIAPSRIKVTRQDSPTPTVIYDGTLASPYRFGLPAGMADTPDGYGNGAAITFNGETTGIFRGDGTFTNGAGVVLNGTVYTTGGTTGTARAVTLTGATGRTTAYWVSGAAWVSR